MALVKYKNRRLDDDRLDAGESVFFLRQLESIDQEVYLKKYPALMARQVLPPETGVPAWANARTYRQYDRQGVAQIIQDESDDLPLSDLQGAEFTSTIKKLGTGYKYSVDEVIAAQATGMPLDSERALLARWNAERAADQIIAKGTMPLANGTNLTVPGLTGLTGITGTTAFTLGTKQLGGTTWGTLAAPNATGDEVAWDLMGIANNLFEATSQIWSSFRFLLNPQQFDYASQKRLGSVSDTTALAFAKGNCPYIEGVYPWWQIPNGTIVAFAPDRTVVAAVVNMEYNTLPPQARNFGWHVPGYLKCGGVISRYPVGMTIATGA
jgi:hypothetical protein